MGEPLTASTTSPSGRAAGASGAGSRRGRGWLAGVPFAIAWSFAAATLNASLAPALRGIDQPRLESPANEPGPPGPPPHKNDVDFDSSELISV
jgi:hypothetical protein